MGLRQFRELKDKKTNIGKGQVFKTYFLKGTVKTIEQWTHKKSGDKSKQYKENYNIDAFKIRAKSKEDAAEEFKKRMHQNFDLDQYEKESKVEDVFIDDVKEAPVADSQEDKDMKMKASTTVEYDFIPADPKCLKNKGECVIDQILGIYQPLIKRLDRKYLMRLCKEYYKTRKHITTIQLDDGINDDSESDDESVLGVWKVEDGICPDCGVCVQAF